MPLSLPLNAIFPYAHHHWHSPYYTLPLSLTLTATTPLLTHTVNISYTVTYPLLITYCQLLSFPTRLPLSLRLIATYTITCTNTLTLFNSYSYYHGTTHALSHCPTVTGRNYCHLQSVLHYCFYCHNLLHNQIITCSFTLLPLPLLTVLLPFTVKPFSLRSLQHYSRAQTDFGRSFLLI